MIGKILNGRYHIIRQLGKGGFGETYLAEDQWLDRDNRCVVKRLKPDVINAVTLRLFETEAQVLTKLGSHDQIPQLLAHFQQDQEFYLVQEFIDGHDLTQEIRTNYQWSETEVIKLLEEILAILEFVHQQNPPVIHRDIKPANIMRRRKDGKIMLIDFGGVKRVKTEGGGSTLLTPVVGTQGYTPDEQWKNKAQLCSDIYAVGIMAIEALTGLQPRQHLRDSKTGQLLWRDRAEVD
ncbi:serine/threonine-protein kinase [Fischerella sp. JS2]|uniref:serine/threonine-protein kinase n=1 Tax=Fischerella sp. JS2 TaxID=2597771 RepID=UPI0028EFB073|nr:serine/threonine-protein kinase [Fischerella sp. JS2]